MSGRRSVAPTFAGLPLSGQQSLVHGAAGSIVGSGVGTEVETGAERAAAVGAGGRFGAGGCTRTRDILLGGQVLLPTELRPRSCVSDRSVRHDSSHKRYRT